MEFLFTCVIELAIVLFVVMMSLDEMLFPVEMLLFAVEMLFPVEMLFDEMLLFPMEMLLFATILLVDDATLDIGF